MNVAHCVFDDMRHTLVQIGAEDKASKVFASMVTDLMAPPMDRGECWTGWTPNEIADFERYNDQSCEFDPT